MSKSAEIISYALKNAVLAPSPISPDWIESGDPTATAALLAQSGDGSTSTVLWECTPGRFTWRYGVDETVHFLAGSVVISAEGMPARRFGAGDTVHFPKGSRATWVVEERIRKVAFCRSTLPAPLQRLEWLSRAMIRRLRGLRSGQAAPQSGLLQS